MEVQNRLNQMLIKKFQNKPITSKTLDEIKYESLSLLKSEIKSNEKRENVKLSVSLENGSLLQLKPANLFTLILMSGFDEIPNEIPELGKLKLQNAKYEVEKLEDDLGNITYISNCYPKNFTIADMLNSMPD